MDTILALIYIVAAYWAVGQTIYYNRIVFYRSGPAFFMQKCFIAAIFGWVLIPVALVMSVIRKK